MVCGFVKSDGIRSSQKKAWFHELPKLQSNTIKHTLSTYEFGGKPAALQGSLRLFELNPNLSD